MRNRHESGGVFCFADGQSAKHDCSDSHALSQYKSPPANYPVAEGLRLRSCRNAGYILGVLLCNASHSASKIFFSDLVLFDTASFSTRIPFFISLAEFFFPFASGRSQ